MQWLHIDYNVTFSVLEGGVRFSVTAANGTSDKLIISANDGESVAITASDLSDIVNFEGPLSDITISLTNPSLIAWSYAIDDMKFAVPEPNSMALIFFGLLMVSPAIKMRRGRGQM